MWRVQEVLGQLMGAGMSRSSGRRIDIALGQGGGMLEQILGGLQQGQGGTRAAAGGGRLGDLLRPQGGGSMPGGSARVGSTAAAGGSGGGGLGGTLGQAGKAGASNPLAAGGLGALAGVVLGRGKSSVGNAIGGAGLAILGSLAMNALRKTGEQKSVEAQAQEMQGRLPGRSAPIPDKWIAIEEDVPLGVRPPQTPGEEAVLASQAMVLLQAMISAAKASGQIDGGEMQRIIGKMEEAGADRGARDFVLQEMRKPLDLDMLVAQVQTPELAVEVYAASLLAIEIDTLVEEAYLRHLAYKLTLHPMVVEHLHQTLGVPLAASSNSSATAADFGVRPFTSELRHIIDRLAEFYSPEEARLWLYAKHRLLNGERPIDLIHAGRADEVLSVIESLDACTYT